MILKIKFLASGVTSTENGKVISSVNYITINQYDSHHILLTENFEWETPND
jgi:hypothetical protein